MRIGLNASFVNSRHNGTTTFVDGALQSLISLGHEVVLYSSAERYRGLKDVELRATPRSLCVGESAGAGVKRFVWMQSVLGHKLKQDRVDLFFTPHVEAMLSCPVPQVVTVHDLIPLLYPEECPRQHYYYKWLLPKILPACLRTLVVSEHTRRDVIQKYGLDPSRVALVYNSLREQFFEPQFGSQPEGFEPSPYFLFVGTFAPRKNLETVIRAFARIHAEVPEKLVVVAYQDRWQAAMQRLCAELAVLDKVAFYAGLKDSELAYLYRHATGLILLSEYEGFGFPPLEAMATGTPALVSDATSLAEVVADAAITSSCRDIDAAAAELAKLSADHAYREGLGQIGAARARQFTWASSTRQLCDAIGSCRSCV